MTAAAGPATLVLLSKPGCHLCEEMRAVVDRVIAGRPLVLVEKDVREDPRLERRYLFEIPVLLHGDRELARYRVSEEELRAALDALTPP